MKVPDESGITRMAPYRSSERTPALSMGNSAFTGVRSTLGAYAELTKPGITIMVTLSAAAGFHLASPGRAVILPSVSTAFAFLTAIGGTAAVAAGSCVLNHVIERRHDRVMRRTMQRPIPSGRVPARRATVFGITLMAGGFLLLAAVNALTLVLAAATAVLYLAAYTPLKRRSPLATLVGCLPGALPALGGWTAVTGTLAPGGAILFLILFFWQMPHFLALSWMYRRDYERAGFAMLSVRDRDGGMVARRIMGFTCMLIAVSIGLAAVASTGAVYLAGATLLGGLFLSSGMSFLHERTNSRARSVLTTSYVYLLVLLTLMFADKV